MQPFADAFVVPANALLGTLGQTKKDMRFEQISFCGDHLPADALHRLGASGSGPIIRIENSAGCGRSVR